MRLLAVLVALALFILAGYQLGLALGQPPGRRWEYRHLVAAPLGAAVALTLFLMLLL